MAARVAVPAQPPPPAPLELRRARLMLGLTQAQAGALIYRTGRTWHSYESGKLPMDAMLFEIWEAKAKRIAAGQFPKKG